MPDNTYVWVVMEEDTSWPVALFQKKYVLRKWLQGQTDDLVSRINILRFPPYGSATFVEVDAFAIREGK